jgi:hypothetical protein
MVAKVLAIQPTATGRVVQAGSEAPARPQAGVSTALVSSAKGSNKQPRTYCNSEREKRMAARFGHDLRQRIVSRGSAELEGIPADARCLIERDALPTTETIHYFAKNISSRRGNLISGGCDALRGLAAGFSPDQAEFPFDGAQMSCNRRNMRIKILRT